MSKLPDTNVKFLHKTENGLYKVWVYMEDYNQPIDLFYGECKVSKEKKRAKLHAQALEIYQKNSAKRIEWESAV